jgi:hypothetical protein
MTVQNHLLRPTIAREQAKEFTVSASKKYVSRYSSLLSIVFSTMLVRPEPAASRANASVTRLDEPRLRKRIDLCYDIQYRLPEADVAAVDFETMYRPMPANGIQVTPRASRTLHRTELYRRRVPVRLQ